MWGIQNFWLVGDDGWFGRTKEKIWCVEFCKMTTTSYKLVVSIMPAIRGLFCLIEKRLYFYSMFVLILDVVYDLMFVYSYGWNEVSSTPNWTSGELFGLLLDPAGRFSLEDLDYIWYWELWWNNYIEMNMLLSDVPLEKNKSFPFADHLEYSFHFCFNIIIKQFASIFGSPY